jgi:bifunctional DNA-binding transcriptional regulator/antitoxin component of YhaV-PrlF toxin-antitoxin module
VGVAPEPTLDTKGGHRVETRRAIKNKTGIYVNIPSEICKALEIKVGDRLKVSYVTGTGIFITQMVGSDKPPTVPGSIEGLKKAADFVCAQAEKKLRAFEHNSISRYCTAIVEQISRLGIFELQKRVDRMEKRTIEVNKIKGQLVLIRQHKKSPG